MVMRDLRNLYVAVCNNEVKVFDTNLKDFHAKLLEIEPGIRNYQYYYREFKKRSLIPFPETGEVKYNLQKLR